MTRRPTKKVSRKRQTKRRYDAAKTKPDPLDAFIAAGARALDLKIERAWIPAVRTHLKVTLAHGTRVAAFVLPDDAEPAPVFEA